jgi:hypothetical protein
MDATPLLASILGAMHKHKLEGILIGNAAAALHGAPVTTLDADFMFRETPTNLRKLKAVARELQATILRPYYPVSKMFRVVNDDRGLQVDFMPVVHGVKSFNSLRSRAARVSVGNHELLLASLADVIVSKKTASRPSDLAVLPVLEQTLHEKEGLEEKGSPVKPGRKPRRPRGGV